jgi:hypothetical protein
MLLAFDQRTNPPMVMTVMLSSIPLLACLPTHQQLSSFLLFGHRNPCPASSLQVETKEGEHVLIRSSYTVCILLTLTDCRFIVQYSSDDHDNAVGAVAVDYEDESFESRIKNVLCHAHACEIEEAADLNFDESLPPSYST